MLQAVAMGVAGGFVMVVFFSFWGARLRTNASRPHPGRRAGAVLALAAATVGV
jgi:hypothetical protein